MSRLRVAMAGVLVAAGGAACTPMQWVKADATEADIRADAAACQQAAWREAWMHSWYYRPISPYIMRDATGRPFYVWPHASFYDPFGDRLMEESRLAQFCMQSKGYRLVPVEPEKKEAGK